MQQPALPSRRHPCLRGRGRSSTFGFTLIELIVVVAIVGIVAAVAIPMYSEHITRGRIAEAVGNLPELRTKAEQYFQDNRTYTGFTLPAVANAQFFAYSLSSTATTYTITASGLEAQGMGGFGYTIDHGNSRATTALPTGWGGVNSTCWVRRKSGTC